MKQRFLQLISVFILVLPLLAACGPLDNQATSRFSDAAQKAVVAVEAQRAAQQAAKVPAQGGKVAQQVSNTTTRSLSNLFSDLPDRITTVQRNSKAALGSWWEKVTQKLSQRQYQPGGSTPFDSKQPKPY